VVDRDLGPLLAGARGAREGDDPQRCPRRDIDESTRFHALTSRKRTITYRRLDASRPLDLRRPLPYDAPHANPKEGHTMRQAAIAFVSLFLLAEAGPAPQ